MAALDSPWLGKFLFIGAVASLILVPVRELLPKKRWHWEANAALEHTLYADEAFGGASYAERVSPDGLHMRCRLVENNADVEPFCGFSIYLNSMADTPLVDLSGYETMRVEMDYLGNNHNLRFYVREFEEGYSDFADDESLKYMSTYVLPEETDSTIIIDMQAFTVADWWVNQRNVPREHTLPSLERVAIFGVDVAYPAALGYHELKLKSATFVGDWVSAEDWYLGILSAWMGVIFVGGGVRLYQFRHLTNELKIQKDEYHHRSSVDQLTQVTSRHGLQEYIDNTLDPQYRNGPVGLIFIDLDHFKSINDTYGHAVGDKVLRRVAARIAGHSRQSDSVTRWGGEEFLMVMPETDASQAAVVAERLRCAVEREPHPEMGSASVTVSIGLTELRPGESFEAALMRGDAALYQAKREGRNRVVYRRDPV